MADRLHHADGGLLDPNCDVLLVGDLLGMVLYGLPSTLAVSLDTMIGHGAAVVRGAKRACVVVDLPFGSYQASPVQAFRNAARVLAETGRPGGETGGRHRNGGDHLLSDLSGAFRFAPISV